MTYANQKIAGKSKMIDLLNARNATRFSRPSIVSLYTKGIMSVNKLRIICKNRNRFLNISNRKILTNAHNNKKMILIQMCHSNYKKINKKLRLNAQFVAKVLLI